jgi:HD-like signal output (HDOD) protein
MTEQKPLLALIREALANQPLNIPVFHAVAVKLQQLLSKPDYTIGDVTDLIAADQSLATQVLRIANSPYYAGLQSVVTINAAVIRLGGKEVANIAMMASQQETYRSTDPQFNQIMQALWRHALACAVGTKWLAEKMGYGDQAQEAFLAALLHDVGKLFLVKVMEEVLAADPQRSTVPLPLIEEVLDTLHVAEGYQVMKRWNLPDLYCEVTKSHHLPDWDDGNHLLSMVRLVNRACHKLAIGLKREEGLVLMTTQEALKLDMKELTLAELEIAIEDALHAMG